MPLMVTGEVVSQRHLNKLNAVVTEVLIEVPANNVAIYAGANIALFRQLEMVTGWEQCWKFIRDEAILDVQFANAVAYAGTNINSKGEADRRIASDVAFFGPDDVIVGVGVGVNQEFRSANTILDSAIRQLIQVAREDILLKAA